MRAGMVVSVDDHSIATVFSDATKEEFKVFTKDLVDCAAEITHDPGDRIVCLWGRCVAISWGFAGGDHWLERPFRRTDR